MRSEERESVEGEGDGEEVEGESGDMVSAVRPRNTYRLAKVFSDWIGEARRTLIIEIQ